MKKLVKIIAGLLFISSFTFANDKVTGPGESDEESLKMAMYFDQSVGTVKTFYEKQVGSDLDVLIYDAKRRILNQTHINKKRNRARVNFDISGLENGLYTLEAYHKGEVIKKAITIKRIKPSKMSHFKMEIL
ncbi:MAG: hypothetical protein ACI9K1_002798 [Arcticibacterium sp.]|jgi:hypothetical protein